jgi:hypothetical protein
MEVCVHEFFFNGIMIDDHVLMYKTWYVLYVCYFWDDDTILEWLVFERRKQLLDCPFDQNGTY